MNNSRRKELDKLCEQIEDIKFRLDRIREDEATYMDNIPENLQGSERYETAEEAVDALESAVDEFDEILEYIETARGR